MTKPFNARNEDTNQIRCFHLAKDKWHFYYEFYGFSLDRKNCLEHQGVLWAHNKISTSKNTKTTNKNQMRVLMSYAIQCHTLFMYDDDFVLFMAHDITMLHSRLFYCNQNKKK